MSCLFLFNCRWLNKDGGRWDEEARWWYLWLLMVLLFAIVVVDDGALGLLVNLFVIYCETCDVCDIYVVLVIYMCFWWYICDVGDVCYIYLLFVWMGCKKQIKKLFSVTLPSVMAMTLGKVTTWEHALPSAKAIALGKHHRFVECHRTCTRQRSPVCRVSCRWHSA